MGSAPPIVTRTVTDVDEFIKWTKKVTRDFKLRSSTLLPWYRGHSDDSYRLKPSIFRCEIEHELERELIRDFKIRALDHLPPLVIAGVKPGLFAGIISSSSYAT